MTTRLDTQTASSATAVAPAIPARPAVGAQPRLTAALVFVLMFSALGALWSQSGRYRDDPSGIAKPPFELESPAWRSLLTVAATRDRSCPGSVPIVVLFVSATCPHCHAELRRWAHLLRGRALQAECIGVVIAAAPSGSSAQLDWIPRDLSPMLLWDHGGAVAHALRARLVPTTAYITRKGVVVARVVGEANEQSTLRHLEELRRSSDEITVQP